VHYKFIAFTATRKIPQFGDLIRKVQAQADKARDLQDRQDKDLQEIMKFYAGRNTKKKFDLKKSQVQPILPLSRKYKTDDEQDKTRFIQLELKVRAGAAASTSSYKKTMRVFELGTPQEWLDLVQDVKEVWRQNVVNGPHDRAGILAALLKGDTLTTFETALEEARRVVNNVGGEEVAEVAALTTDHVEQAISAVSSTVFPHRALETQRQWMQRYMKKPRDMSARNTSAAISRINNCLPMFPHGSQASKFSEKEIVGLFEWSLPEKWQKKLGIKGFDPSQHTREELIEQCEIIERHEPEYENEKTENNKNNNNKNSKFRKTETNKKKGDDRASGGYFCKECGPNGTHSTVNCFKIRNRERREAEKGNGKAQAKQAFSKRSFRKEVNALARKANKNDALDLYVSALKRAQAKVDKKRRSSHKKARADSDPESSDSDESMNNLENPVPRKLQDLYCAKTGKAYKNTYTKESHLYSPEHLHEKMAGDLWFGQSIATLPFGEKPKKKVKFAKDKKEESSPDTDMEVDAEEEAFLRAVDKEEQKLASKSKKRKAKKAEKEKGNESDDFSA
jgi:hypothetical protein